MKQFFNHINKKKTSQLNQIDADRTAFGEYIAKNIALYNLRTGLKQSCHATANYMSTELAAAMRKGPYQVNTILAGFDAPGAGDAEGTLGKPALYWLDYMGALQQCNFGVHGYAASFMLSVFDSQWKVCFFTAVSFLFFILFVFLITLNPNNTKNVSLYYSFTGKFDIGRRFRTCQKMCKSIKNKIYDEST